MLAYPQKVRGICRLHIGTIDVRSPVKVGCTVAIYLPLRHTNSRLRHPNDRPATGRVEENWTVLLAMFFCYCCCCFTLTRHASNERHKSTKHGHRLHPEAVRYAERRVPVYLSHEVKNTKLLHAILSAALSILQRSFRQSD